jgi:hypothetical protein
LVNIVKNIFVDIQILHSCSYEIKLAVNALAQSRVHIHWASFAIFHPFIFLSMYVQNVLIFTWSKFTEVPFEAENCKNWGRGIFAAGGHMLPKWEFYVITQSERASVHGSR